MLLPRWTAVAIALATGAAQAQFFAPNPNWKESEVPPPPAFNAKKLMPVEGPAGSLLKFGVDPATVVLEKDGVVRFVVVATSESGTVNSLYEGIRCESGEIKVYGRHHPGSGWTVAKDPKWQDLKDVRGHGLMLARNGVCNGNVANGSAEQIVRDLGGPVNARFGAQSGR